MSGRVEGLETQVGGEGPSEEVAEEAGKDVEEDEGGEEGADGEDAVSLGDVDLLLEAVEGCRLRVRAVVSLQPDKKRLKRGVTHQGTWRAVQRRGGMSDAVAWRGKEGQLGLPVISTPSVSEYWTAGSYLLL